MGLGRAQWMRRRAVERRAVEKRAVAGGAQGAEGRKRGAGSPGAGLEVGGGADAEAGGFLVEEAGRGQILRGQAE